MKGNCCWRDMVALFVVFIKVKFSIFLNSQSSLRWCTSIDLMLFGPVMMGHFIYFTFLICMVIMYNFNKTRSNIIVFQLCFFLGSADPILSVGGGRTSLFQTVFYLIYQKRKGAFSFDKKKNKTVNFQFVCKTIKRWQNMMLDWKPSTYPWIFHNSNIMSGIQTKKGKHDEN